MTNKQPPFEINERIMADVIEIAELVGRVSVTDKISMNPTLRRTNRIQTIYSSLAIEQNTHRTSHCCFIGQTCYCTAKGYCGSTECL